MPEAEVDLDNLSVRYRENGPFILRWVWLGAILMALGGVIAAADRRYRRSRQSQEAASKYQLQTNLQAAANSP